MALGAFLGLHKLPFMARRVEVLSCSWHPQLRPAGLCVAVGGQRTLIRALLRRQSRQCIRARHALPIAATSWGGVHQGRRLLCKTMSNKPNRRWLRFSIRTLLVAVTIFCVWLGWQVSIVRERTRALAELRQEGHTAL